MAVSRVWSPGGFRGEWAQRALLRRSPATMAGLGAFVLIATATATAPGLGGGLLTAAATAAQQAADMVAERSPGLRTRADMSKGKPRLLVDRVSRALPRIRDARPAASPGAAAAPLPAGIGGPLEPLPPVAGAGPAFFAPGGAFGGIVLADAGPGFGAFPPPPGFGIGGGGGGGIVIAPPAAPPAEVVPPVTPPVATTPIPEPATWMTMILGFAAIGGAIRRRASARTA